MAKQKKLAKVHYNPEEDSFELWLMCDGEWGFSCSARCYTVEGDTDANHIHFSFLRKVLECIKLGYDVIEE